MENGHLGISTPSSTSEVNVLTSKHAVANTNRRQRNAGLNSDLSYTKIVNVNDDGLMSSYQNQSNDPKQLTTRSEAFLNENVDASNRLLVEIELG